MSNTIEEFFITPLEAHFESQPTDGGRDTIMNDMQGISAEDLNTAVEWLKRARQSVKTFPSPKECNKAIAAVTGGRTVGPVAYRGNEITSENYAANAIAFCGGLQVIPVIHVETPQWQEWMAYWEWLGVRWLINIVKDRKSWTVPSEFPEQFDPRFNRTKAISK